MGAHRDEVETIADVLSRSTLLLSRYLVDTAGLSPSASTVLFNLDTDGPVRLTVLAAAVEMSQPSMTQLVQRLERRDLVTRAPDPLDRRATLVSITDAGRQLFLDGREGVHDRLGRLLTQLSETDRATLHLAARVALPIVEALIGAADRDDVPSARLG
jgi:DNA-binding MarR family transcriptional regulator